MRKPSSIGRKTGVLLALSWIGLLGVVALRTPEPDEPTYNGKLLSSWLNHHVSHSGARPPYGSPGWKEADEAIRSIGSQAVPTLVKMLRAKEKPKWFQNAMDYGRRMGFPIRESRHPIELHEEAEYAFQILGKEGVAAVPELIRIYESAVSPSSQHNTAKALGHIGPGAQAALPILIADFSNTDPFIKRYAVGAVIRIGGQPERVIPALTEALSDSSVGVRWNALSGLSRYRRQAESAIPRILEMLNDTASLGDTPIQQQVETTLWRIAPESVPVRLVIEASSPIATDGQTAQAIKANFLGERRILIDTGKSIPTAGQHWYSDPRPSLTFYRGNRESDENDTFLGEFEVMGIPDEEGINISTLCVLADENIILCARDNNRHTFLKIRRIR